MKSNEELIALLRRALPVIAAIGDQEPQPWHNDAQRSAFAKARRLADDMRAALAETTQ